MIDENLMASSFENFGRVLARGMISILDIVSSVWNNVKPLAEKFMKYQQTSNKLTKRNSESFYRHLEFKGMR